MDSHTTGSEATEEAQKRACDQCRIRKIRCDKESPCSNCRTALRACSSTGAGQKPKQPGQRVLISTQYERKIDLIEERLGNIEELLRSISFRQASEERSQPRSQYRTPSYAPSGSVPGESVTAAGNATASASASATGANPRYESDSDSAFEGDSSLAAQSVFASEFLQKAVERTSLRDAANPSMEHALSSLRHIVAMGHKSSPAQELQFPLRRPVPAGGLMELPMPPMPAVVGLLKFLKDGLPGLFSIALCFIKIEEFSEMCRKVYFCTEEISETTFITVNAGLYYLFLEQTFLTPDPAAKQEYYEHQQMCQVNLDTALSNLPLLLPGKAESIEALLLGALYAIDISKPSLAWHLTSTAAQLCLTLGYHRTSGSKSESSSGFDSKMILFWHAYILDKGLSLRLGRASNFQDWDITVPRLVDRSMLPSPWAPIITAWIKHTDIQSRTYELLYSPQAMSRSRAELAQHAQQLAQELEVAAAEASVARRLAAEEWKGVNASQMLDLHMRGDVISFYTTLTLIYRAIPAPEGSPSSFCGECIETARLAMQAHQECIELSASNIYLQAVYIHWAILLTPFAPFFVLFCHVIESSSAEDMNRLQAFVTSLLPACPLSESVEKLHRLCQVLYSVATLYLEAKSQQQADQNMAPIGDEFDVYLSALGFMPVDNQMSADLTGGESSQMMGQTTQLADWFSGNRYMMELLERDISQFNSMEWS